MLGAELHGLPIKQDVPGAICPSKLQPLIRILLAMLSDLEFDYQRERERICELTEDTSLRIRVLERLRIRHNERRESYINHLAILQEALMRQMQGV